ncbi:MAG TPA: sugar ABC transporter permease [Solirubrobacteraceae bacterium]|jgi:ABC-type sugar transport system permease subunit|nr:sugar ABC transporter permease [Solirubrobacteraceae bacterium]
MLSPAMIVMAAFVFVPIVLTLWISLHSWTMLTPITSMKWVGLKNYSGLLSDPDFTSAFRNTVVYVLLSLVITVPLSYVFGLLLYFPNIAWKGLVRTLLFATYVIPSVAVALVWSELYEPIYGPLARIFQLLGLGQPSFLTSPSTALLCLVIFQVWQMVGYYTILVTAGLTQIPGELYEVAKLDGVGVIRQAFQITLPLMRRTMVLIGLLAVVNSIQLFDPVYLLTQGGPVNSTNVLSFAIQRDAFEYGLAGQASAMAVSLVIVLAAVAGVFLSAGKLGTLVRRLIGRGAR